MGARTRLLLLTFAAAIVAARAARASNPVVANETANIAFDTALSFTGVTNIDFGAVKANQAGTYTVNTAGALTASGGGVIETGTPAAGQVTITGSTTQPITISAGNYTADQGVSISNATGKYGTAAEQAFPITGPAPGTGTVLKLGVTVSPDGTEGDGVTAHPTFDINVIYQ